VISPSVVPEFVTFILQVRSLALQTTELETIDSVAGEALVPVVGVTVETMVVVIVVVETTVVVVVLVENPPTRYVVPKINPAPMKMPKTSRPAVEAVEEAVLASFNRLGESEPG
jgi:hypothetical protein